MFSHCVHLKEITLNNFNTIMVKDMSFMFSKCICLKYLYINHFNDCRYIKYK